MSDELEEVIVDIAVDALGRSTLESRCASHIKKNMDQRYGAAWHCVVGENFAGYVTHEKQNYIHFTLGNATILLFKTTPAS
nr:unnamed protein product [Spirometra erinaceieuropaei]